MTTTQFKTGLVSVDPTTLVETPISNQRQLDRAIANGLDIEDTSVPAAPVPPSGKPAGKKGGKPEMTYEEAVAEADANLAESFGMPSEIEALGLGVEYELVVIKYIRQTKKIKENGTFPSVQVAYKNTKFCVLFDKRLKPGLVFDAKNVSSWDENQQKFLTRSEMSVQPIW